MGSGRVADVLFLNGTVGVGKTTTAEEVGRWLQRHRVPHAVVDADELRRLWPAPPGDPFNAAVELANARDVVANHRRAGALRVVIAGVIEDRPARADYEAAVGAPLVVVRLRAGVPGLRTRLAVRHRGDDDVLRWHHHRCAELHAVLEAAGVDDHVLDVDGMAPHQVATAVLRTVGWAPDDGAGGPRAGDR